jgi:hypothetical protein
LKAYGLAPNSLSMLLRLGDRSGEPVTLLIAPSGVGLGGVEPGLRFGELGLRDRHGRRARSQHRLDAEDESFAGQGREGESESERADGGEEPELRDAQD